MLKAPSATFIQFIENKFGPVFICITGLMFLVLAIGHNSFYLLVPPDFLKCFNLLHIENKHC